MFNFSVNVFYTILRNSFQSPKCKILTIYKYQDRYCLLFMLYFIQVHGTFSVKGVQIYSVETKAWRVSEHFITHYEVVWLFFLVLCAFSPHWGSIESWKMHPNPHKINERLSFNLLFLLFNVSMWFRRFPSRCFGVSSRAFTWRACSRARWGVGAVSAERCSQDMQKTLRSSHVKTELGTRLNCIDCHNNVHHVR